MAAPLCLGSRVQGTSDRTWATALRRRAPVRTARYRRRARGGCGPRPTQGKARRLYQLNLVEATAHSVAVNPVPRPGFSMEAEALCSAGGGDPAGAVGRVLGPRLAPSPAQAQAQAQAQRSPGRAPEPTSRRLGREHCTDWGTSLEGDHGLGVVEEGESPKLHGASSGTPDLGTDGPEEDPVGASLCPSHHRPVGGGGEVVRGKGEPGSPLLVPPTVVEDLTI